MTGKETKKRTNKSKTGSTTTQVNANQKGVVASQSTADAIGRRIGAIEFVVEKGMIKIDTERTVIIAMNETEERNETAIVVTEDEIGTIETVAAIVKTLWLLRHMRETEIAIEMIPWALHPSTETEIGFEMSQWVQETGIVIVTILAWTDLKEITDRQGSMGLHLQEGRVRRRDEMALLQDEMVLLRDEMARLRDEMVHLRRNEGTGLLLAATVTMDDSPMIGDESLHSTAEIDEILVVLLLVLLLVVETGKGAAVVE